MTIKSQNDPKDPRGAVVALSGGQDSATCLFYAVNRYERVAAVTFRYGQRHAVELDCARNLAHIAGVPIQTVPIGAFEVLSDAALTNPKIRVEAVAGEAELKPAADENTWATKRGLPSTFVPGRNIVLLSLAAAYGLPRGFDVVVTGVCAMDRAGYPDCREEFVQSVRNTIALGMDDLHFEIDAPLLRRTKAETWALAHELGVLQTVKRESHTCYEGDHDTWNDWGYGCGDCPACDARRDGYDEFVGRASASIGP